MRDFTVPPQLQTSFGSYLPSILGAVAILVGGIIIALLVRAGIRKALTALRVDERVNRETDTTIEVTRLIASMGFWFVMILALLGMFSILRIEGLSGPFEALVSSIMLYLPRILLAAILALVAWLLATLLRAGLNRLMAMTGWDEKLSSSAGVKPLSSVLGNVVYWVVLLLFLPAIVGALQIEGLMAPLSDMTNQFVAALPAIFAAVVIGVVGWLIAKVVRGLVTNLLAAAGVDRFSNKAGLTEGVRLSQLGGTLAFILVIVPTLIAALDALQIDAIAQPARDMLSMFLLAIPNILAAALILVIAWFVGRFVAGLITSLLENLGFDRLPERLGFGHAFDRSPGIHVVEVDGGAMVDSTSAATVGDTASLPSLSEFMGKVALFFIMLFATVEAAHRLGFVGVRSLLASFIAFGADVLLGAAILVIGYWLADLAAKAIQRANPANAVGLARIARIAILGLVLAMGLRAMGIADDIVNLAFGLVLGAVAVATALAFGLGGREAAGKVAQRWADRYMGKSDRGSLVPGAPQDKDVLHARGALQAPPSEGLLVSGQRGTLAPTDANPALTAALQHYSVECAPSSAHYLEQFMGLDHVATGTNPPHEINVIIEIPKDSEPVKYEVDKDSGAIFVDRILSTPMRYPCNYGYVPHTLCGDGDPADVLVVLPLSLIPGSVIRCRPVGVLRMSDEAGSDEKILAVPATTVFNGYAHIEDIGQVSPHWLERIGHFFEHYKDLEKGKWVKLDGWGDAAEARGILSESMARYESSTDKPKF